jgi:ketosteroid isomerase-like protein
MDGAVDKEIKSGSANPPAADSAADKHHDQSVDEFFTQLQSDMRRPDLSQEAISAAFQAIQKLALDTDSEEAADATVPSAARASGSVCEACQAPNPSASRFCSACGAALSLAPSTDVQPASTPVTAQPGDHHYHHHYHHHYFPAANGVPQSMVPPSLAPEARPIVGPVGVRDASRPRSPQPGTPMSRAETAVRKISRNWAQACNTKQLDDLVELYAADALVLRPNFPPVRGTAAIREFFFAALDSGLGEAEMEPLRVELFGDVAFEAGRCKTLVPTPAGKRREERGKYLLVMLREPGGDWKTIADCWNNDLSLGL